MTNRRTDNTMTKRRRADNTMTKRKKTNKQHDFLPSFIRELFYHFNSFKISFWWTKTTYLFKYSCVVTSNHISWFLFTLCVNYCL
jgi:hypothetical protein